MISTLHRAAVPFALAATLVLGACGKDASNNALSQDTTLARDLARAGADSAAQPQLQDVPATVAEATPAPPPVRPKAPSPQPKQKSAPPAATKSEPAAPPAAPPSGGETTVTKSEPGSEPAMGSIPAGTTLTLSSVDKVCTNTSQVGDRFTATVTESIAGSNGASIPSGSKLVIEVTKLHKSENANDQIQMGFRVVSLTVADKTYSPDADIVTAQIDRVRTTSGGEDAKKVIGGAVAGAIIGQIIGRDRKGTLIGAAAGAAAGGAAAAATGNYDGCVNAGAPLTVKLNAPLTIAALP